MHDGSKGDRNWKSKKLETVTKVISVSLNEGFSRIFIVLSSMQYVFRRNEVALI